MVTDVLAEIIQERTLAQTELLAAEALLKETAGDPELWRVAKRRHREAQEWLERLAWAEQAEREQQNRPA
jgi:hypothetical protein